MSGRFGFVLRRLLLTIPVLFAMSIIVFMVLQLVPGDPATTLLGIRATPSAVAQLNAELHLDESLPSQYLHWIEGVVQGDLGKDFVTGESVTNLIGQALPTTLELAFGALLVGTILGMAFGVAAARGPGKARAFTDGFVVSGTALPDFFVGILLILLFSTTLAWLPPSGWTPFTEDPVENLRYMFLPIAALGIGQAAYFARFVRASVEGAYRGHYVLLLRAKGLSERRILWAHALRNASAPIVTVIGIQFGVLLGGTIVIESLFSLPGVGQLLITSIGQRNYTVVQGAILMIAVMFIVINLVTDLIVGWLDPRVADSGAQ